MDFRIFVIIFQGIVLNTMLVSNICMFCMYKYGAYKKVACVIM